MSRKWEGLAEEDLDLHEAALAAATESSEISVHISSQTPNITFLFLLQEQQAGCSSIRLSWAQLGCAVLGCMCPLPQGPRKRNSHSLRHCVLMREDRDLPAQVWHVTCPHIAVVRASHMTKSSYGGGGVHTTSRDIWQWWEEINNWKQIIPSIVLCYFSLSSLFSTPFQKHIPCGLSRPNHSHHWAGT